MDIPSSPSPVPHYGMRRRKKRSTPTNSVPGSSLTGLNRGSIRVVELIRGSMGYGFTISGQKPCLLRCIVEGSPADRAGLRPGNCLVGVNGKDVSHLAHDDVVSIIGSCTGLLRLHVADSYFSESSDEECFQSVQQSRPKYPHRPRPSNSKSGTSSSSSKKLPLYPKMPSVGSACEESIPIKCPKSPESLHRSSSPSARRSSWDPLMPTPRRVPRPPYLCDEESPIPAIPPRGQNKPPTSISSFQKSVNPNVEIIRVFGHLESPSGSSCSSSSKLAPMTKLIPTPQFSPASTSNDRFNTHSSSGSSSRREKSGNMRNCSGNQPTCQNSKSVQGSESNYQAVVGYIGSVEIPEVQEKKRLQAISACVKKLRLEKRVRSIVLLRIQPNGISLYSSNQNVHNGPPLAFYSSSIISFCGAYSDDRRFFGVVTCTGSRQNYSCHVFMVEPKLLSHSEHTRHARCFGIHCTALSAPKSGQVLGLQECAEFPATADSILNSILRLHRMTTDDLTPRSPSEASTRLESTNSSNSDSGIGFRDDCDRNSAQIYDILEPERSTISEQLKSRSSPQSRKKGAPGIRKSSHHQYQSLGSCNGYGYKESGAQISSKQTSSRETDKSRMANTSSSSSFPYSSDVIGKSTSSFDADPRALEEILHSSPADCVVSGARELPSTSKIHSSNNRLSLDGSRQPPRPIEVSVLVTPPRCRENRSSMDKITPISPNGNEGFSKSNPNRASVSRHGTRSLENLCMADEEISNPLDSRNSIGSSTPALNQDVKNSGVEWEFKVPHRPKPKMDGNRAKKWAESIEKLLADPNGLQVFTEFLQHEFSAENIHFYTECLMFKEAFPSLTQSQRISVASTIFQKYLQNGATDPVNVDFQARCQCEKSLYEPTQDMFDSTLAQVFNLLKFDCYPRFLRSDVYRDYSSGALALPPLPGEPSDSDQESVKSHKLSLDGRRRSLLPWNIKNRSKKNKSKGDPDCLNTDLSFIQQAALNPICDGSDQEEGFRRQSYKICRVVLPDNSTTVVPCMPGETLGVIVQKLLKKREFHYSTFEVISVASGKALDVNMQVTEMTVREIKVEPRAFIGIELPHGWKVGVRANPIRKVAEVLKPILSQHSLKLDAVVVYDLETCEILDTKLPMGKVDSHNLLVKSKAEAKLEEITNHIQEYGSYVHPFVDDDHASVKTSSSQASSVFRDFLRRSSKKYKRKNKGAPQYNSLEEPLGKEVSQERHPTGTRSDIESEPERSSTPLPKLSDEENSLPSQYLGSSLPHLAMGKSAPDSPLSLIPSELNLKENSRNRKPIYISQTSDKKSHDNTS